MKKFVLIAIIFFGLQPTTLSQTLIKDTIYISKNTMSHLVFTDGVAMSDYGSSVINSDGGQPVVRQVNDTYVIILKAKKRFKDDTNISIITDTNLYYDITCRYSEKPVNNFYYFDYGNKLTDAYADQKNENQEPEIVLSEDERDEEVLSATRKDSILKAQFKSYYTDTVKFKGVAKRIYSSKTKRVKGKFSRVDKISLSLIGVYARKDKLYVKLDIYNGGTLPYNIFNWNYHFKKKGGFESETVPEYTVQPIYEYNSLFQSVLPEDHLTKVFVFDQFSLEGSQSLYIQLLEKDGQRNPVVEISSKYINNAYVIKGSKQN